MEQHLHKSQVGLNSGSVALTVNLGIVVTPRDKLTRWPYYYRSVSIEKPVWPQGGCNRGGLTTTGHQFSLYLHYNLPGTV